MKLKFSPYYVAAAAILLGSISTAAMLVPDRVTAPAAAAPAGQATTPLASVDPALRQRESVFPYGGAIPVVYAYGKPYERGVQIGKQLHALSPDMLREVAASRWRQMMEGIPGITREGSVTLVDQYLEAIRKQLGADLVDEYVEEMRGVGDGAQVSFNEMFMLNLGGFYRKYFIDEKGHTTPYYPDRGGCSSFAAWGKATADGKMIATHNCDWGRSPDRSAKVAVVMAPERGNRLVYAAPVGTWGSHHITSDRLFVAGLALGFPKAKPRYFIPEGPNGMMQRWIVQYSTSAQDAFDRYQATTVGDRGVATPAGNVVYVDRNEAIYLQTAPDKVGRIPNRDGYNAVTNHIVLDEMRPHFLRGDKASTSAGSENRLNSLLHLLQENYGRIDVGTAASIMSSHYDFAGGRENVFAHTLCQHGEFRGSASGTTLSTIAKLDEGAVWLALGNPCVATWRKITIGTAADIKGAADAALAAIQGRTTEAR
jgi:isopenicillin-N N-acyltransferase-like protein